MKKYVLVIFLMLMGALAPIVPVLADTGSARIVISQFKVTSSYGQFFTLYNNTNSSIDMTKVQLQYFNNYALSNATTSKNITLSGTLLPHAYYGVNDGAFQLCYQSMVDSVSLGFSSTAGMVQVSEISQSGSGQGVIQTVDDFVAWIANSTSNPPSSPPAGVQMLPVASAVSLIARLPLDTNNNPVVTSPGGGTWQAANMNNNCSVTIINGSAVIAPPLGQLLPGTPPPATIITADDSQQSINSSLPASDIGLAAPIINELLPNPAEPQTDSEDEFIELYNSNDVAFDLTGFKLQTGTTSLHTYTFLAGSSLTPKSFTAFYSIDTNLSLGNSGGQARLLDPAGDTISQSGLYGSAPDGQSWALANGTWYFTTTPTAGGANVINQPLSVKTLSVGTATTAAKKSATAASKTTATPKVKAASTSLGNGSSSPTAKNASPLHPLVLAGVGAGAVAYAAYEYRNDLANRLYQLRRYRTARRATGKRSKNAITNRVSSGFRRWQDNLRSRFSSWFGE